MIQEFTQEIKDHVHDILSEIHTTIPGKIVAFDPDDCTATIQPFGFFKKPDGSKLAYPQLNDVPVHTMQGSGQTATFAMPIRPGDDCLIFFAEQALDTWRTKAESDTELHFDLTNASALVGLFSTPNRLIREACADDAIIIEKDGARIRLKKGEASIRDNAGQSITLTPTEVSIVANSVNVQTSGSATVTAAGDVSLTGSTINLN